MKYHTMQDSLFILSIGLTIVAILINNNVFAARVKRQEPEEESKSTEYEEQEVLTGPISIGRFNEFSHDMKASDITIESEKAIVISNMEYDGEGPAAWWILGHADDTSYQREFVDLDADSYTIIPDEDGSCERLPRYRRETIRLNIPDGLEISNYEYIGIYCLRFNQLFGYAEIPDYKFANATGKNVDGCPQELAQRLEEEEEEEEEDNY